MNTRDERLRDLLRGADPATGDPGLPPEEVQAMRRAVLTAVAEPRRRWIPALALAGSALAAIVLAILLLKPVPERPSTPPRPPERVTAAPAPLPAPEIVAEQPEPLPVPRKPRKKPAPAPAVLAKAEPEVTPELPVEPEPAAVVAAETRQIQFSTPGGTRIIWVLTSDGATY